MAKSKPKATKRAREVPARRKTQDDELSAEQLDQAAGGIVIHGAPQLGAQQVPRTPSHSPLIAKALVDNE